MYKCEHSFADIVSKHFSMPKSWFLNIIPILVHTGSYVTKYHGLGSLNNNIYCSQLQRLGSPRPRCQQIQCLARAQILGLVSHLLTGSSLGRSSEEAVLFLNRALILLTRAPPSSLNASQRPHSPSHCRVGFQQMNSGGGRRWAQTFSVQQLPWNKKIHDSFEKTVFSRGRK